MGTDTSELTGIATIELIGPDGEVKESITTKNIVTTAGDLYYANMAAAGVSPATPSAPTLVSGMKLGTGTTAAAKSGAGAANLGTYISASNQAFDASFPDVNAVAGTNTGYTVDYKTTWAAGDVTNSAITEAVIVNDAATNATSTEANTISRITFTAVNKTADDSLVITWKHKFLGA